MHSQVWVIWKSHGWKRNPPPLLFETETFVFQHIGMLHVKEKYIHIKLITMERVDLQGDMPILQNKMQVAQNTPTL